MNLLASLRYLAALDEHKHFGRAALACHITQPALSNALRALEAEFGCAIVIRGRSFGGFTSEGERVLLSGQRMLHERQLLQQDLSSAAGRPQGSLLIGSVPTAIPIAARFAATLQARHPGIAPVVRSMSSAELENGLESLSLDMGLGYTDRLARYSPRLRHIPQYSEQYFLVRKASEQPSNAMKIGTGMTWAEAALLPLCLLSREMHNRSLMEAVFSQVGAVVKPAIQTNSILTLILSVSAGDVCSIVPGTLVSTMRGYHELEALPLLDPDVRTPVGFMVQGGDRTSRALDAAMQLAQDAEWMQSIAGYGGLPDRCPD